MFEGARPEEATDTYCTTQRVTNNRLRSRISLKLGPRI